MPPSPRPAARVLRRSRPSSPLFAAHEPPPADPLLDWLALTRIEGLGPVRLARLLERFGHPSAVFASAPAQRAEIDLPSRVRQALDRGPDHRWALDQVRSAEEFGAALVCLDDPLYPQALRHIPLPPPVLWVAGAAALEHPAAIGVVGTRSPTTTGAEACRFLVRSWARDGLRIVSGLARGIDELAHRACLEAGGDTVAVLGCGLDQLEQPSRRDLARAIAAQGAVVTEFPFGDPVVKGNFPRRNRIIAGLSQAVVVVEAGETSGALITARNALDQGREVLACPGGVGWPSFAGCHRLLREGAPLCADPSDLTRLMGWESTPSRRASDPLLHLLSGPGATPEEIAATMHRNASDILIELVRRELSGEVERAPGGRWRRADLP